MNEKINNSRTKPGEGLLFTGRLVLIIALMTGLWVPIISRADQPAPEPVEAPAQNTDKIFGLEMFPLNNVGGLQYVLGTQTKFVRGAEIVWADIEPTDGGGFDWSKMATAVQEIANAKSVPGAEVIIVVRQTPAWAQKVPGYSCGPMAANRYGRFSIFISAVIEKLKEIEPTNVGFYWQIWNEPDIPLATSVPDQWWGGCWGDASLPLFGGAEYGTMLNVVAPIIRAFDPTAKILIGGLQLECDPQNPPLGKTCASSHFLEGILTTANPNSFDGVALHAYDDYLGELGKFGNYQWPGASWDQLGPSLVSKARFVKAVLAKKGITNKLLMSTENSLVGPDMSTYNDPYPPDLETTKSYYVAQAYAASIAEGLTTNIWFDVVGSWLRNNGLIKVDASETLPAYDAYKFAAEKLAGAQYVGTITSYPGVAGYEFDIGNNQHIWLIWSRDGQIYPIHLPATPFEVYNVIGTPVFPTSSTIDITLEPLYLVMPALVVRGMLPVSVRTEIQMLGNFDAGQDGWTFINGGLPAARISTHPLNPVTGSPDSSVPIGTASVQLGSGAYSCTNVDVGYAAIEKLVTVPIANGQVRLDFQYIIYSQEDVSTNNTLDAFEVYITDSQTVVTFSDGNKIRNSQSCPWFRVPTPVGLNNRPTLNNWAVGSIDLTAYRGQTVLISFRNYNRPDKYYNTYTFLDEIKLISSW